MPTPDEFYTKAQRALQSDAQHDKLSEVVVHAIVRDELEEIHTDYITSRDYFFLSTVDGEGMPTVSYKGGDVGFVKVLGPNRLIFPNYDGNGMWLSMGNISDAANVGMLFMDMVTPWRIRVQGKAKLCKDPALMADFPGCNMVVDVAVTVVFQNCARYIHKHTRVETSPYVPDAEGNQPFPAWKRIEPLQPFLHPDDQGRAEQEGGTLSEEEYLEKVQDGTS
ncbi:MAG: pyridoxamine 5'-phosphate oxidase family protein [Pseudomonadota bacterium]